MHLHRFLPEVESSRTHFQVLGLGLEGQVLGLGFEASSPRKLACPRLEDSTIIWIVKILWSAWKIFWKTFFRGDRLKNFCEDLIFLESTCACVLGPWPPWPRAFLSLALRVFVLGKAVLGLGLGFFLCPWPWPRIFFVSLALASSLVSSTPPLVSTTVGICSFLKLCRKTAETLRKISENLFCFLFLEIAWKNFEDLFCFFLENTCDCVLGLEHSSPWRREGLSSEGLSLASDIFVSLASSLVSSTPPLLKTQLFHSDN